MSWSYSLIFTLPSLSSPLFFPISFLLFSLLLSLLRFLLFLSLELKVPVSLVPVAPHTSRLTAVSILPLPSQVLGLDPSLYTFTSSQ